MPVAQLQATMPCVQAKAKKAVNVSPLMMPCVSGCCSLLLLDLQSSPLPLLLLLIFCCLYVLFLNGFAPCLNILGGKALVESLCEGISAENADEDSLARLRAEFDILETVENEEPQSDDESDCSE